MLSLWLIVLGTCSPGGGASGEPDLLAARQAYLEGEHAYRLGRFEEAVAAFARAYDHKPLPALLFNMAQSSMELRRYDEAIFFYQGYLREAPNAENRALVQSRIAEAESALARHRAWLEHWEREAALARERKLQSTQPWHHQPWFWTVLASAVVSAAGTAVALHYLDPFDRARTP